ncbi:MAG TPA: AlpA family phage regulatory protein [Rhodanobacter sp.]|nr:AlpA family phage regulatory protein [Rhodanobacter sp.]
MIQRETTPAQLLRLPAVIERVGLSRSTIYRAEAAGTFPKRVKVGEHATAWLASDIERFIAERVAASRVLA